MQPRPQDIPEPNYHDLSEALAMAEAVKGALAPLTGFGLLSDGASVERDSQRWARRFFRPEASPWFEGRKAERLYAKSAEAFDDLLVHRYGLGDDLQLEVTESVEFVLVRVGLKSGFALQGGDVPPAVLLAGLADRVLQREGEAAFLGEFRPYKWVFQYQPPLAEGSRFTTAPERTELFETWADRVDGGIDQGQLVFYGTKHHSSGDGRLIFLSGHGWFDGSCWAPYRGK